jgi:hypothetical protein
MVALAFDGVPSVALLDEESTSENDSCASLLFSIVVRTDT